MTEKPWKKIRTVGDVRDEKRLSELPMHERMDREAAERARIAAVLRDHPEIGELCREGRRVFYVNSPYRESDDPAMLTGKQQG